VDRHDIPTPALLVDIDAMDRNIARMSRHLANRGVGFRPHGKTHKCPAIARRLIGAGAIGICAAKLSEAEVFAAAGVRGLLVTTAVVGAAKIGRAVRLASLAPDTVFCADDADNVRAFAEAAGAAAAPLNLAVDLYFGRTGVAPGEPAARLAHLIDTLPGLRFAGLQAYDSSASHIIGFDARRRRTLETMTQAIETRRLIESRGIDCPMVSAGSTGTYLVDADLEGLTELQPGSFIFMDVDYRRIGGPAAESYDDFERALTVITTVVSSHADAAIVDGGYKAFSTDRPWTPEAAGRSGVTYSWAGDEHGRVEFSASAGRLTVGDRIEFFVPHCDPTVNLYDRIYAMRGNRIEDIWPIAARGMSQ
jgi:D-serine deaminase-like pyridoxal phosphate-dependent protein